MSEGAHILFIEGALRPKTRTWEVWSKAHEAGGKPGETGASALGTVKWYGAWRCYAFFPAPNTLFEKNCLRDLAQFCEARTVEHKAKGVR